MEGVVAAPPIDRFDARVEASPNAPGRRFWHQVWRARGELQIVLEASRRRRTIQTGTWIVFDPLTRSSVRIGYAEHWLLTRLDGRRSVLVLAREFLQMHAGEGMTLESLYGILCRIRSAGWVRRIDGEACEPTESRADASSGSVEAVGRTITNLVVWRIRGWNPDPWLRRVAPRTNGLFSPAAVVGWLAAAVVTSAFVGLDFTRLSRQTMEGAWIADLRNTTQFLGILIVTRAVHELGHAIVCRRFGVRCPDIGMLMILGAPCVYCDVSESWRLPTWRGRAAVAAAGVYAELVIATAAAWVWLLTVEGTANTAALQTMLICSVSTLAINLNPLMRYDGYYLLSDWLDAPNLRAQADRERNRLLRWCLLGHEIGSAGRGGALWGWALFSLASWGYRCMLSVVLALAAMAVARVWYVVWVGRLFAVLLVVCWVVVPLLRGVVQMARASRTWWELARLVFLASVAAGVVVALPIPARRMAEGVIQPAECYGVYATVAGHLAGSGIEDGQPVDSGGELFRLASPELEMELAREQFAAARRQRDMHAVELDLGRYESAVRAAEALLESARRQAEGLCVRAPARGVFYRAVAPPPPAEEHGDWRPVSSRWGATVHVGRSVDVGQLLGVVVGDDRFAAIPLSESQLSDIAVGTPVEMALHGGQQVVRGTVSEIGRLDQIAGVWAEAFGGPDSESYASFRERSQDAAADADRFAAVVTLSGQVDAEFGSQVQAVFHTPSRTLLNRLADWMRSNLRILAD